MEQLSVDIAAQIQWSNWSHCESSFNLVLVPHHPGVYALAEEVDEAEEATGEPNASAGSREHWARAEQLAAEPLRTSEPNASVGSREHWARAEQLAAEPLRKRRKLAIFSIQETGNLAYATSNLFALGNPVGEHMVHSRCYVRYAVIQDPEQRHAVHAALQAWLALNSQRTAGVMKPQKTKQALHNEAMRRETITRPLPPL